MNLMAKRSFLSCIILVLTSISFAQSPSTNTANPTRLTKEKYCDPANNTESLSKVKTHGDELNFLENSQIIKKHTIANKINEEMNNLKCVYREKN